MRPCDIFLSQCTAVPSITFASAVHAKISDLKAVGMCAGTVLQHAPSHHGCLMKSMLVVYNVFHHVNNPVTVKFELSHTFLTQKGHKSVVAMHQLGYCIADCGCCGTRAQFGHEVLEDVYLFCLSGRSTFTIMSSSRAASGSCNTLLSMSECVTLCSCNVQGQSMSRIHGPGTPRWSHTS